MKASLRIKRLVPFDDKRPSPGKSGNTMWIDAYMRIPAAQDEAEKFRCSQCGQNFPSEDAREEHEALDSHCFDCGRLVSVAEDDEQKDLCEGCRNAEKTNH
jgi:DNA-directed RNA polymerase subunit RPC12/RpoP